MVEHDYILRGLRLDGLDERPPILKRIDQDFITVILDELASQEGFGRLAASVVRPEEGLGLAKLFQPVHRIFYVILLEVACDVFGQPRLDPRQIENAGLVIRRQAINEETGRLKSPLVREGWRQAGPLRRGWLAFTDQGEQVTGQGEQSLDPDPQFRRPELSAGHPEINRRLALLNRVAEPLAEQISPLFVAPAAVCTAAKKTILYGLVPVTSSELSQTPDQDAAALPVYNPELIRGHLPTYLTEGGPRSFPARFRNQRLSYTAAESAELADFIDMLRQVAIEFDAFGDSPQATRLFQALNQIKLETEDHQIIPAGNFLKEATNILVERQGIDSASPPTVFIPNRWQVINSALAQEILSSIIDSMETRLATFSAGQSRFEAPGRRYQARAFVRIRQAKGCPSKIVWSQYSQPFTIAPWYETGEAPPTQIPLPDVMDRDALKKLKPNVSFVVPEGLFNFLQKNGLENFLPDGTPDRSSGGLALDWICSFNIFIITLCAFIVLNIFLALFDLFFRWLLFIKICLPIPRRSGP